VSLQNAENLDSREVSEVRVYHANREPEVSSLISPQLPTTSGLPSDDITQNTIDTSFSPISYTPTPDVNSELGTQTNCSTFHAKPSLNRRSRRRLAREINSVSYIVRSDQLGSSGKSLLELKRRMARPPGTTFLGSRATEALVTINGFKDTSKVIIDSGSDITLISQQALSQLSSRPRIRAGQNINLVQVTGSTTISGFVDIDLYFDTQEGPVKIPVEAYVVEGMSTPLILGNDFADQYDLSIVRREGQSFLSFGDTGRELEVQNSVGISHVDMEGKAFKVSVRRDRSNVLPRSKLHRRAQRIRRHYRRKTLRGEAMAARRTVIPPEASKVIPVQAFFPTGVEQLFVEQCIRHNANPDDAYGAADTLISRSQPVLHVANFSKKPVVIEKGEFLGSCYNPETWLDKPHRLSSEQQMKLDTYARLIRTLLEQNHVPHRSISNPIRSFSEISSKAQRNATGEDDPTATAPLEGGPKTAEVHVEDISSDRLLDEISISPDLSEQQRRHLEEVLLRNAGAFGLDGKLGNFDAKVDIKLKPGSQPVSLPPFPTSPANREVIDTQMDSWLNLGVIEPSRSPWGAPAFIVHRNGKPRMVIDLRKLNSMVIPDEFLLPKQEDILQALSGAQWLTTLDALAGFTQLTMTDDAAEKLAFRTHRGLYQFRRMPFGYRNGPSVFQRVMQGVLAPFLWVFALVYIDDIVIFSKSFEDHIQHIDAVLQAISKARITLSPPKCHFAYQSLLLLGQKVSRLGSSTHKEKVDAILALAEPRNPTELQTFLGMMVYFSTYIPFYAWIAQPLFQLLKKGTEWTWTDLHQEAFDLCKEVLTNAPVRSFAIPGRPYRLYTDACDYGLAGILQQVQPIRVGDLKGTKLFDKLENAFRNGEPIPNLVISVCKDFSDVPPSEGWSTNFEETVVYVERVISYWSRVLKSPERNYSATEREALALKEALIKFQPFIEGEDILAITDHAALTWSTTFQNVNRRLLTWGTIFAAYPQMRIIHRAGRVHSNVDPISRLRRRVPFQESPDITFISPIPSGKDDPLRDMYTELGNRFEERLLSVASRYAQTILWDSDLSSADAHSTAFAVESLPTDIHPSSLPYKTSRNYSLLVNFSADELKRWRTADAPVELSIKVGSFGLGSEVLRGKDCKKRTRMSPNC
jgi:hypothetical protein